MPKLGLCSWAASRVGLMEKHLGQQRPDTRCGTLEMDPGQCLECDPPALSPLLGYPGENCRTGDPTMACGHSGRHQAALSWAKAGTRDSQEESKSAGWYCPQVPLPGHTNLGWRKGGVGGK